MEHFPSFLHFIDTWLLEGLDELASFLIILEMNFLQTSQQPTPNFFVAC